MKDTKKESNRKSLCNLSPVDELINRGVIFYQLPHLMMIYSGLSESKSDCFLKTERLIRNSPELTSDRQIYRNIRDDSVSREDFLNYVNKLTKPESAEKHMSLLDSYVINSNNIGGWCLLDSFVKGVKLSNKNPELKSYLDFILSLCDHDKKLIDETNTSLIDECKYWLHLPDEHLNESSDIRQAQYLIARILYWAALFEHFLIIDQPELVENSSDSGYPFSFNNYIPENNKKGDVVHSVEMFLDRFKNNWGKSQHSKDNIRWAELSRDVANAIADNHPESDHDFDPESIRKDFSRWRKGELQLTIKSFKKKIAILYGSCDEFDNLDSAFMIIPYIQLFDSIQRELLKEGISREYIVKQFERYPVYLELVSQRYKEFSENKSVTT